MERLQIFNAGPAVLPEEVLREAQADLLNYKGMGLSVMEMSHRSKEYEAIINGARDAIKRIYGLGEDYEVLFMQGGATLQFLTVPMNFCPGDKKANYINTGVWATKAVKEAKKLGKAIHVAASSEDEKFSYVPRQWTLSDNPAYLHITSNNTIYGTEFDFDPEIPNNIPLVSDMSSNFMSKPIDIKKYSLIYAGAQKNIGPAGCVVVIIKKEMLDQINPNVPTILNYKTHADAGSMHNTPPCWAIYIIGLVMKWIEDMGGLTKIHENNLAKAKYIYDIIDESDGYYKGTVRKDSRSLMNVTFRLNSEEMEEAFIKEAKANGMIGLKGHRDVGGCRASIYNALPLKACHDLADFMKAFRAKNA